MKDETKYYAGGAAEGFGTYGGNVINSIVWGNNGENYKNSSLLYSCSTPLPAGIGNIATDPLFIDSVNNIFRLQSISLCFNKGSNGSVKTEVDLDGYPRILDGVVDMGAYECGIAQNFAHRYDLPETTIAVCGSASSSCIVFDNQTVQIKGALLGDNKSQGFTFSPTGSGRLIFRWNVSSEYSFDTLNFYMDSVLTAQISGKNVSWTSVTNTVTEVGTHTFKWEYAKDGDTSVGQDSAWIADVVWTTATTTTEVPVPFSWLNQYSPMLGFAGGDYEAAALADVDGDGHLAWQEYVAGSVPTNRESVLRTLIAVSNGLSCVTWTPDVVTARVYRVTGKTHLTDGAWGATNGASRFFRVKVSMP